EEADHRGELVVLAVFGEIRSGEQAERRADADADHGHQDRADDGVAQAAVGRSRRRRILGEDGEVDAGEAVVEQREQDQREPGHTEQRGTDAKRADDDVEDRKSTRLNSSLLPYTTLFRSPMPTPITVIRIEPMMALRRPPSVDPGGGVSWVKTARLMPARPL